MLHETKEKRHLETASHDKNRLEEIIITLASAQTRKTEIGNFKYFTGQKSTKHVVLVVSNKNPRMNTGAMGIKFIS